MQSKCLTRVFKCIRFLRFCFLMYVRVSYTHVCIFLKREYCLNTRERCLLLAGPRLITRLFSWRSKMFRFLKNTFYLFLENGERREKERERNIHVWLPLTSSLVGIWPTTKVWTYPNWESNWWPFGSQATAQSTEPYQPWAKCSDFKELNVNWIFF